MRWKVGTGNSRRNVRLAPQHSSTQVINAFYYSKGTGDGTCSRQRSRRSRRGRWGHPERACFLVSLLRSRRGGRGPGPGPGPGPGARGPHLHAGGRRVGFFTLQRILTFVAWSRGTTAKIGKSQPRLARLSVLRFAVPWMSAGLGSNAGEWALRSAQRAAQARFIQNKHVSHFSQPILSSGDVVWRRPPPALRTGLRPRRSSRRRIAVGGRGGERPEEGPRGTFRPPPLPPPHLEERRGRRPRSPAAASPPGEAGCPSPAAT